MFSSLSLLTHFALESNFLTGTFPPSMASLSNLNWLDVSYNSMQGSLPLVTGATNLSTVYLNYNLLSGTIPDAFGKLSNLLNLRLDSNQVCAAVTWDD